MVATIRPLQFVAQAILGVHGNASSLIDGNDSAHHFNLTPSDRVRISEADLMIWIGPDFEVHLSEVIGSIVVDKELVTAMDAQGLQQLYLNQTEALDGHIWLGPENGKAIAAAIVKELKILRPSLADDFDENFKSFDESLRVEKSRIERLLMEHKEKKFIVYHNGFQYFENEFGLRHSLALVSDPEVSPSIREIVSTRKQVTELKPLCLFQESDSDKELIDTMLNGYELQNRTIDLLGFSVENSSDAYIKLMAHVANEFSTCLSEN